MSYTILLELLQYTYWFILLIAFILRLLIAGKFNSIAIMKGHDSHFGWCFWLGVIGYLMVIALPDLNARPKVPEKKDVPIPNQVTEEFNNNNLTNETVIKPLTEEEKRILEEKAAKNEKAKRRVDLCVIAVFFFIVFFLLAVKILEKSGLVFV